MRYEPRGAMVIIRKVKQKAQVRGLAMPERSAEGTNFFVEAVGPEVKDLKKGQQVMLGGPADDMFFPMPGEPDLIIAPQRLVMYIIHKEEGDDDQKIVTR